MPIFKMDHRSILQLKSIAESFVILKASDNLMNIFIAVSSFIAAAMQSKGCPISCSFTASISFSPSSIFFYIKMIGV